MKRWLMGIASQLTQRCRSTAFVAVLFATLLGAVLRVHGLGAGVWPFKTSVVGESWHRTFIRGANEWHFSQPDELLIWSYMNLLSFKRPVNLNPHFFTYGSLFLYLHKIIADPWFYLWTRDVASGGAEAGAGGPVETRYILQFMAGRWTSFLLGTATIPLIFLMGRRWLGRTEGIIAALFLSICVYHIQASHFLTVDVPLLFLVSCCLHFCGRVMLAGRARDYIWSGVFLGLSVTTKLSAVFLVPMVVGCHLGFLRQQGLLFSLMSWRKWLPLVLAGAVSFVVFFIGTPYAFIGSEGWDRSSGPLINRVLNPEFVEWVMLEDARVRNVGERRQDDWMIQYEETPAYLYQMRNWCGCAMGPFLGISAIAGTILLCFDRKRRKQPTVLFLLAWVLVFFGYTGRTHAKFLRHSLPLYCHLCLTAAYLVVRIGELGKRWSLRHQRICLASAFAVVFLPTLVYALAFQTIYSRDNTRARARDWLRQNVRPSTVKFVVHKDGWSERFSPYRVAVKFQVMALHTPSDREKALKMAETLGWGNCLVITSNCLMGSLPRVPDRYPFAAAYFKLLVSGRLGYDLVAVFNSYPSLGGLTVRDDTADGSFTLYDHPKVLIFAKGDPVGKEEIASLLLTPPDEVMGMGLKDLLTYPPLDWLPPVEHPFARPK